jgi:hypothetical protein
MKLRSKELLVTQQRYRYRTSTAINSAKLAYNLSELVQELLIWATDALPVSDEVAAKQPLSMK